MVYLQRHIRKLVTLVGLGILLSLSLTSQAADLKPVIPTAKGGQCVEKTDVMRKNHMEFILHQRNDTLRRGIRTSKHSLKECIECHNAPANDGKVARISEKDHFCSSCHTFAAVKIDCFECHADKPEAAQYRTSAKGGH
ncbi:MAG: Hdr-like menaquinol oxidoreductase cytochrome c subunit [Gammaproteobacteria bacterium]|nr:Hdr-like menaquinol oxidoreductase cytochrome c subunit [Gammaproteobacteria bacterium]MDH5652347.1 Hdr-like menaquinol oxidoreductase cytochrome c subunit [Gammaproteobacteria bacterium]